LFYRTENGIQSGQNLGDDAYQYNVELGVNLSGHKISGEYSLAGANYVQMYPTAHKFLGFADVLGRKNLKHMALHYKAKPVDFLKVMFTYHDFKRNDTDKNASKLTGGAWGTSGTSDDIGSEFDLVLTYLTKSQLSFQLGTTLFQPGQYLKDQQNGEEEDVKFHYLQLLAKF
jgi:hypothetical protein